jgi:hypothetical protein
MKLFVKLLIVALIVNAAWRLGSVYYSHYQFEDSVREALIGRRQTDDQLRRRILELAADNDIPLDEGGFSIRRGDRHIYVNGGYERGVAVLPGYQYPLHLSVAVDAYVLNP